MATRVVTVKDVLDGNVGLDVGCSDRITSTVDTDPAGAWASGQVLDQHLGFPIPSPVILERIGCR